MQNRILYGFGWWLCSKDVVELVTRMLYLLKDFEGDVPGACAKDCGNYLDMNLNMAKYVSYKYYNEVLKDIDETRLVLPK